jgi:hypothetical protein
MSDSTRAGMALPLAILLLLGMTVLGHGALLLSRHEVRATAALRDRIRAERAAVIGLQLNWRVPTAPRGSTEWMPHASGGLPWGLHYEVTGRWLDRDFFILSGIGRVTGRSAQVRMVWVGREGTCGEAPEPSGS